MRGSSKFTAHGQSAESTVGVVTGRMKTGADQLREHCVTFAVLVIIMIALPADH